LEELLGTKLRALYQRSKGRDLYDQYKALTKVTGLDINKIIQSYYTYMKNTDTGPPSQEEYINNIEEKMSNPEFIGDTTALIRPEENWDAYEAFKLINRKLLTKL
jgi:predicted nucleotidyltransferase component of viral defense system